MSIASALTNDIYLTYLAVVCSLLASAGVVLMISRAVGHEVSAALASLRGWLIMIPLVFIVILLGREAVIIGVALLAIFGFKEFARASNLYDDWWLSGCVYIAIVALAAGSYVTDPRLGVHGWYGIFMTLPVYVIAIILLIPVLRNHAHGQLRQVSLAVFGFVYFGWMFSHLGFIANTNNAYGYLLYLIFAIAINDVAAFTAGKIFGKHKLRANISPNKTIEGALGAIMVSLIVPWLLWFSFPHFEPWMLVVTGLIVGIGGQLGDLIISYTKRDIGIKDMGAVIRGHGGILDRIDSMIFVAPIFFHVTRWFHGMD